MAFHTSPRQRIAYQEVCNLWQPSRSINATTGAVATEVFTLAYSNVPFLFQNTPNYSQIPRAGGRLKQDSLLTSDTMHFYADQEIGEGWIVKDVTLNPDGSTPRTYGKFYRVQGEPQPNRRGNKQSVETVNIEHPPTGVS